MRVTEVGRLAGLMAPGNVELLGEPTALIGPDVVIDNRVVTPGALFVAIPGNRVDGHDFAAQAAEAGAKAILATRSTNAQVPHLLVDNTVVGLSWLARGIVRQAREQGMLSLGITGSSGKTSTKDLLAQLLETAGDTVSPVGSQNNEIGVPLTACKVTDDTRYLVSEMGARGLGHISWLTSLVPLDIGVVLNVGTAHVGEFGDLATTAQAKSELIVELPPTGWAVLNADDPAVKQMASATTAQLAWFGTGELPQGELRVTASEITTNEFAQPRFVMRADWKSGDSQQAVVELAVVGRHQVSNALAAATAALAAGIPLPRIAQVLSGAQSRSVWRMELRSREDGVLVLNDAYNANPDSMAAALATAVELGQYQRTMHPKARVVAVLGDMLELGPTAIEQHLALGRAAVDLGVTEVIAVGEYAQHICLGAAELGVAAQEMSRDEVASKLELNPGDVVLIKASRGVGLEQVATDLTTSMEA